MALELPASLVAYFADRETQRANAVETFLASLTAYERHLVHDCAVMGYVRGMTHPAGEQIPKDSAITAQVIDACFAFPDPYPAVNATPEQRGRAETVEQERDRLAAELETARAACASADLRAAKAGQAVTRLGGILPIVEAYVVESNDFGGLDCNDLVTRLEEAGFPLPGGDV